MSDFLDPNKILRELQQKGSQFDPVGVTLGDIPLFNTAPAGRGQAAFNPYTSPITDKELGAQGGVDMSTFKTVSAMQNQAEREADRREREAERKARAAERDAAKDLKTSEGGLDDIIRKDLGLDPASSVTATTTLAGVGAAPTMRIRAELDWPSVTNSPEWKALPVEEQAKQRPLWVQARVGEAVARVEAAGYKVKDKEIAELRKKYDDLTKTSLSKRPESSWTDTDYFDRAVKSVKDVYQGARLAYGDTATREDALKQLKANDAEWQANMNAVTADNLKKAAMWRNDMLNATEKATGKRELTVGQEAEIAAKVFNLDKVGAILGNLPTTLLSLGVSAAGGLAAGAVTGGAGAAAGASAAGAAVNVPLTVADVSGGLADTIGNMSEQDLAKSPRWQALLAANSGNVNAAKTAFIGELVDEAKPLASAIGGASGALEGVIGAGKLLGVGKAAAGNTAAKITEQVLSKVGLSGASKTAALKTFAANIGKPAAGLISTATAKGIGGELVQEFGEEGAGQVAQNLAMRAKDLETGIFTGATEAGVSGALTGAGTAAGAAVGKSAYGSLLGPKRDSNGDFLLVEKNGQLTRTSNGKLSAASNLAIDQNSGLMRLVDAETGKDPEANALTAYRNNANVFSRVASAQGLDVEKAGLVGSALAASMFGDQVSAVATPTINLPSGVPIQFSVNGNGTVTPVMPTNATPQLLAEAQSVADAANSAAAPVLEQVNAFWGRTTGVAPAPGALTARGVVSTQQTQTTGGANAIQVGSTTQVPVGNGPQAGQTVGQGNAQGQAPAQGQAQTQVTPPAAPAFDTQLEEAIRLTAYGDERSLLTSILGQLRNPGTPANVRQSLEQQARDVIQTAPPLEQGQPLPSGVLGARASLGENFGANRQPATPLDVATAAARAAMGDRSVPAFTPPPLPPAAVPPAAVPPAPTFTAGQQVQYRGQPATIESVNGLYGTVTLRLPDNSTAGVNPSEVTPVVSAQQSAAAPTTTLSQQEREALAAADGSVRRYRDNDRLSYYEKLRDITNTIKRTITTNPVLNDLYVNNPGALPENLQWARLNLGLEVSTNADTSPVGEAVRAATDPLTAVADSSRAGTANANAAAAVLDMYAQSNVPMPTLVYSDTTPPRGTRGSYSYGGNAHTVTFFRTTTFTTIPHEYLHGLTAKGYSAMLAGSPEQRDTAALLRHLTTLMPQEAYMTARGDAAAAPYEALAELFRPEAVAFMSQNTYDLSTFPPEARRAAERLLAAPQGRIFDLFMSTIISILRTIVPTQRLAAVENSLADLMSRVAAEAVQATVQRTGGVSQDGAFAPAAPAAPVAPPVLPVLPDAVRLEIYNNAVAAGIPANWLRDTARGVYVTAPMNNRGVAVVPSQGQRLAQALRYATGSGLPFREVTPPSGGGMFVLLTAPTTAPAAAPAAPTTPAAPAAPTTITATTTVSDFDVYTGARDAEEEVLALLPENVRADGEARSQFLQVFRGASGRTTIADILNRASSNAWQEGQSARLEAEEARNDGDDDTWREQLELADEFEAAYDALDDAERAIRAGQAPAAPAPAAPTQAQALLDLRQQSNQGNGEWNLGEALGVTTDATITFNQEIAGFPAGTLLRVTRPGRGNMRIRAVQSPFNVPDVILYTADVENTIAQYPDLSWTVTPAAPAAPAAPAPAPAPLNQAPLLPINTPLPRELSNARPNYARGARRWTLSFNRAIDKAAYIVRNREERSDRDADYMAFVQSLTGWSEAQVREHGDAVKAAIERSALNEAAGQPSITVAPVPLAQPVARPASTPSAATRSTASTAAPGGTTPPIITPAPAAAAPTPPAPGEIRQGMSITITAGPRWAGQGDRPFGENGPGFGYTYNVGDITDVVGRPVATVSNPSATRTVDVRELQARVQSGELALRDNGAAGQNGGAPSDGAIPGMQQVGPTPPFQFSRNTPQANYRTMPNDGFVARLVQALGDRVARLRMYKSSRFIADGSLPANILPAGTSNADKMQAYETFVRTYAAEANRALQTALAATPDGDLNAKRAVAFDLFKIRHTNRQGGEITNRNGVEHRRGKYLAEIQGDERGITFIYKSLDGSSSASASPSMYSGIGTIAYGTTEFTTGSGEGSIHYDAVYGAAVHAGLVVKTNSFTAANQRRMPLNRTRAVTKWGAYFGNLDAAVKSLMGMETSSFEDTTEGGAATAFSAASSTMITLPLLIQHAEQQVMNALHPNARQLGYDFATNQVVVGPNREPVADLKAWAKTQSPAQANGYFTDSPSHDAVKLLAILRELANNPTADPAAALQQLNLTEADALFDRAPGAVDETADNFILDGDDDTDGTDGTPPGGGKKLLAKGTVTRTPAQITAEIDRRIADGSMTSELGAQLQRELTDAADAAYEQQVRERTGIAPDDILFDRAPGDFAIGQAAIPATDVRGITQALTSPGLSPRARVTKAKPFLRNISDFVVEQFADSLIPTVRWIQSLPIGEQVKVSLLGSMYAAPDIRDTILERAEKEFGGEQLNLSLNTMFNKLRQTRKDVTLEDVIQDAGYWATARYSKLKNERMLAADEQAVIEAQTQVAAAQALNAPQAEIAALQAEVNRLEGIYEDRKFALAQPANTNVHVGRPVPSGERPQIGLAGGFNNAKADEVIAAAERQFGAQALQEMAKHLYKLNAFRMATDIVSGRTDPAQAALFSPELEALLPEMQRLAQISADPNGNQRALDQARRDFVNKLANTSTYVPTTGDPEQGFEMDVLGSGFKTPNTARDKRLLGRSTSLANDGITASLGGMQRSASAAGWNKFTAQIEGVYDSMTDAQRDDAGIARVPITALDRLSDNMIIRNQPDGSAVGYTIKDGKVLQALRKENVEDRSSVMRVMEIPNQIFARLATRYNLPFGPINALRDVWERSENMRAREYFTPGGKKLDSDKLARRMIEIARQPGVLKDLTSYYWAQAQGKPQPDSVYSNYMREFEELGGGGSKYGASISRDRKSLVADVAAAKGGVIKPTYEFINKYVNFWNDSFDGVAPLAAYVAMRQSGMSKEAAAQGAKDLMNFRKSGAFMPLVRAIYAFAQPTVTGAVNLANTLKTKTGQKRFMGYAVAMFAIQSILAAAGGEDEETGKNLFDSLDDYARERSLPLPIPGTNEFLKMPIGFGLPLMAHLAALRSRDLAGGEATPGETINSVLTDIAQTITPLQASKISLSDSPIRAAVQTLAPTFAKPIANIAINRGGLGQQIVREEFFAKGDEARFRAEQGAPLTAEFYKDTAKFVQSTFGLDFAPEEIKELSSMFSLGLFRNLQQAVIDNPNKELQGRPTATPIIGSFLVSADNALVRDSRKFEATAQELVKRRNSNPETEFSPQEEQTLEQYAQWLALETEFRKRGAALTRAGVAKGVDPARLELRQERTAAQADLLRQFNATR